MTYTPDPARYQQLIVGGPTGPVDCTAHGGAWVTDAHTKGAIKLSGRAIRLASSEPIPDPASPGLNVGQVDAAIYRLTNGRVNLDTVDPRVMTRAALKARVVAGAWVNLAVKRAVLVDRGMGGSNGFRGAHDVTVHCNPGDSTPVIGDPLVPYYIRSTWDAVLDAAQAVTPSGLLFTSFTRDLIPEYRVHIPGGSDGGSRRFWRYYMDANGSVNRRAISSTRGFTARCTPPRYYPGRYARQFVRLTDGSRAGWWIDARFASER